MIKYLGSKRQLISWIIETIQSNFPNCTSVLDLFSGTSRVGKALKSEGYSVYANDHNLFAYHLAHCYVETNICELPENFPQVIAHLNGLKGTPGFFTENYCEKARFFHPKNGERIDAIRNEIDQLDVPEKIRSVLLVSLMEAADRIDSTCGIQMAFLKEWAKRAHQPLNLRIPDLLPASPHGPSKAHCLDALDAAQTIKTDVAYLDPPYNQHSYRGNYHIWETLVRWDHPEIYGRARKRIDCKTKKSDFNSKRKFRHTLENVFTNLQAPNFVLSFSDEGFISREELESMLSAYGKLKVFDMDYDRYVGAKIGIYNHQGKKVGNVKKLKNKESLYIIHRN